MEMKDKALKLADELSQYTINDGVDDLNKRTIAMIRRLIEENDRITRDLIGASLYEHDYKTLIEKLKPLSDEEIADGISDIIDAVGLNDDCMDDEWIKSGVDKFRSLFTTVSPQTKPLSDEEIAIIAEKFWIDGSFDDGYLDDIGFARAIEERHGIK